MRLFASRACSSSRRQCSDSTAAGLMTKTRRRRFPRSPRAGRAANGSPAGCRRGRPRPRSRRPRARRSAGGRTRHCRGARRREVRPCIRARGRSSRRQLPGVQSSPGFSPASPSALGSPSSFALLRGPDLLARRGALHLDRLGAVGDHVARLAQPDLVAQQLVAARLLEPLEQLRRVVLALARAERLDQLLVGRARSPRRRRPRRAPPRGAARARRPPRRRRSGRGGPCPASARRPAGRSRGTCSWRSIRSHIS